MLYLPTNFVDDFLIACMIDQAGFTDMLSGGDGDPIL